MTRHAATMRRTIALPASLLALLLLVPVPARSDHGIFSSRLDSARVVGNASGGAGCTEGFGGGLGGWFPVNGDPIASGGFVSFEAPGAQSGVLRTFYDVGLEREDIQAPAPCSVSAGGGNATLTTEWVNDLPNLPGDSFGHQLVYGLSTTVAESIVVDLRFYDAEVAAELGVAPGLYVAQSKLLLDTTDPNDIVLSAPIQTQPVPITEAQLAAAVGQRIYLRLSYDDAGGTVVASYSLDGEVSYQTPFTPVSSSLPFAVAPAFFWATVTSVLPPADPGGFLHQLDSARIDGNASGGAGCSEDFGSGLGGWSVVNGDPMASGGFVAFQDPGALSGVLRNFYELELEREDIQAPSACFLFAGGGDATLTTEWVNHEPRLPGGFYGHQLVYALSPTAAQAIVVDLRLFDAEVAAEAGVPPGLHVAQSKLLLDTTDPDDIVLSAIAEVQTAPITEAQLAAATGQRIHLRLSYDEVAGAVFASYSLDGEASYQTPFTPVSTDLPFTPTPGFFWAGGGVFTRTADVPVVSPLGSIVLVGLLLVGFAGSRRVRRSRPASFSR